MDLPLLEMMGITKAFPGATALDKVTFDLRRGELHALVGENGAGKSTLMKILSGVYPHGSYEGDIRIDGAARRFGSVRDATAAGIAVVYQELSLVRGMTVGENIFLGREPRQYGVVRWRDLYGRARDLLESLHLTVDPHTPVEQLGIGQQQLTEICKALSQNSRILILDEPSAALTDAEVETLVDVLNKLRARGVGIVYITHKLEEVFRLADRVTVLRDGRVAGSAPRADLDERGLIAMMVGREMSTLFPQPGEAAKQDAAALDVRGLSVWSPSVAGRKIVDDVSFTVRRGEVVGIAGLMGAGRSDLLMAIFGAHPGRTSGDVRVGGARLHPRDPRDAIRKGIGFVTEDRQRYGLILEQPIVKNLALAALRRLTGRVLTSDAREVAAGSRVARDLQIRASSLLAPVATLSGGNQQKVVLGKWLLVEPAVLLLDEPTRGIDVGAKQEFYTIIRRLAGAGLAIVLVSSELPEVLGLSDRVLVLRGGRLAGEFARGHATPETVMAAAAGSETAA
jgi:D-xylose transport system ATP-binding protein